ncbi:MAG TPA: hypothetical protein VI981_04790 [Candidatus Paceibacterota bacterium]
MSKKTFYLVSVTLLLFISASHVFAAGLSVSPSKIEVFLSEGESASIRIKIGNPTKDVEVFEIYPDALEDVISVSPKSFTLESKEERIVLITVSALEPKTYETDLSVVGRPLGSRSFQAGSGAKIPIKIIVDKKAFSLVRYRKIVKNPFTLIFLAVAIALGSYKLGRVRRGRGTPQNASHP